MNWFIPDLHGSVAGSLDAAETTVVNAIRYDAWGQTIQTGTAGGTRVGDKAWKYQGRLDVSPDGLATPLYDMSARFYNPGSGTFTQLDSVMGSAQDPRSMNRFLYAGANPATLIDPTGHKYMVDDERSAFAGPIVKTKSGKVYSKPTYRKFAYRTAAKRLLRHRFDRDAGIRRSAKRTIPPLFRSLPEAKRIGYSSGGGGGTGGFLKTSLDGRRHESDANQWMVPGMLANTPLGPRLVPGFPVCSDDKCPSEAGGGGGGGPAARNLLKQFVRGSAEMNAAATAARGVGNVIRGVDDLLGIVYRRTDRSGGKPYIGQAKSPERFWERQTEHGRANPEADFRFEEVGAAKPGRDLDRLEEFWIRQEGGPTNKSNPDGALANRRHQMRDERYFEYDE